MEPEFSLYPTFTRLKSSWLLQGKGLHFHEKILNLLYLKKTYIANINPFTEFKR